MDSEIVQSRVPRKTVLGRYRIVGELGRGAMGVVYHAVDPLLERSVAIKTVNLAEAGDDAAEYDARFQQEAKAAGRLAHPNVITVYDVGREADIAFMAMELLQGRDLRSMITDRQRVPVAEAVSIAAQVADGLAYAHAHGVVHRDIKPGNIMILASGLAKIMDFGIARVRTSDVRTKTGVLLGSPKYISPEQVRGQGADERSDIFSLGVVLYEMLSGSAPFSGDSVSSLMYQIATAIPPAPSRTNAAVPPILDLVIAKALAKQPDERYQCAAELAADLRECGVRLVSPSPERADERTAAAARAIRSPSEARGTRPLSSHFDSLQATRRMAAATGMQQAVETHARTLRIASSAPGPAAPARQDIDHLSRAGRPSTPVWNREERLVLGASVTIAGIVAVLIALA